MPGIETKRPGRTTRRTGKDRGRAPQNSDPPRSRCSSSIRGNLTEGATHAGSLRRTSPQSLPSSYRLSLLLSTCLTSWSAPHVHRVFPEWDCDRVPSVARCGAAPCPRCCSLAEMRDGATGYSPSDHGSDTRAHRPMLRVSLAACHVPHLDPPPEEISCFPWRNCEMMVDTEGIVRTMRTVHMESGRR